MSDEKTEEQIAEEALEEGMDLKSALVAMINDYAFKAVQYKTQHTSARTAVKRDFYAKKLLANNEEAADAIITLERIIAEEKQSDEAPNDAPENA